MVYFIGNPRPQDPDLETGTREILAKVRIGLDSLEKLEMAGAMALVGGAEGD